MIIPEDDWNRAVTIHGAGPSTDPPISTTEPPNYHDVVDRRPTNHRSREPTSSNSTRMSRRPEMSGSASGLTPAEEYKRSVARGSITYTFMQQSFNAMVLIYQPASVPVYHISTHLNIFIPSSHITVVHRGDSEAGDLVGQFEMGVSVKKSTVTIDGREKLTDSVLFKGKGRSDRMWQWRWYNDDNMHLSWSFDSQVKQCYLKHKGPGTQEPPLLASYTPPPLTPRADGKPAPLATMKIYPEGQALFDQILISALIIERKRLTPSSSLSLMSWSI
ncbi:hypothetical protein ABKN59_007741 [Abortiporus biennis]